jgi:hypothetical protein
MVATGTHQQTNADHPLQVVIINNHVLHLHAHHFHLPIAVLVFKEIQIVIGIPMIKNVN